MSGQLVDWPAVCLKDLGTKSKPAIKAGPFGSSLKKEDYVSGGYKVYGQEQVIRGDATYGDYFIDKNKYQALKTCSVSPGDILISLVGTMGKVLVVPEGAQAGVINPRLLRLSLDRKKIFPEFAKLFFEDFNTAKILKRWSQGGTMDVLNADMVGNLKVTLPPLPEQTAIASLLSTWDAAIEKTERLLAAKEKGYGGLVNRLIIAPARTNRRWKRLRIRDIADRVQRRSKGGEYPVLTIASASGFVLQEEKYSRYMAGESVKNYILLRRGEFAYNKGNSLRYQFGCIFELKSYDAALVPHVYVCFKPHEGISPSYLGHLFAADYLKPQLGAIVKTGVRNNGLLNIRPEEFMNVTVPIPPFNHQQQIANTLDTARQEIDLLKKQAAAYRRQKRGLMQKLLTGEWRVKVTEDK